MTYICEIKAALERLYKCDSALIEKSAALERAIAFRLGKYLADILENHGDNLYVDCEYYSDENSADNSYHKNVSVNDSDTQDISPDIIYHDRKTNNRNNKFCIELKIPKSTNNYGRLSDDEKVKKLTDVTGKYRYHEGFCIYGLNIDDVTIKRFMSGVEVMPELVYNVNRKPCGEVELTL